MENVSEILWVILRSLSRDIENFPMSVTDFEYHFGLDITVLFQNTDLSILLCRMLQ
jgi:hypothetical protein